MVVCFPVCNERFAVRNIRTRRWAVEEICGTVSGKLLPGFATVIPSLFQPLVATFSAFSNLLKFEGVSMGNAEDRPPWRPVPVIARGDIQPRLNMGDCLASACARPRRP